MDHLSQLLTLLRLSIRHFPNNINVLQAKTELAFIVWLEKEQKKIIYAWVGWLLSLPSVTRI